MVESRPRRNFRQTLCQQCATETNQGMTFAERCSHDPQTEIRAIPPVFTEEESEDRQTAKPWHVRHPRRSREARACRSILQKAIKKPGFLKKPGLRLLARLTWNRRLPPKRGSIPPGPPSQRASS